MRAWVIGAAAAGIVVGYAGGKLVVQAQTIEIDKTLGRVYGTPIRSADVREARILKLVPDAASDEAVQRALENRLLILHEMRVEAGDPGRDAIAARRQSWGQSWPAGTDLPALMARCGTTDQALDAWFRSDLQIQAFVSQRFGQAGEPGRDAKVNEWIAELRRRANLR